MTTYNSAAVADSVIAFQKGITLQQGRSLRDNPIAISEGSTDAPINRSGWHPYNALLVGDGNTGLVYDHAVSGSVSEIVTPDFEDKYEYLIFWDGMVPATAPSDLTIEWLRETSGSYTPPATLDVGVTGSGTSGMIEALHPRRATTVYQNIPLGGAPQKILRARIKFSVNVAAGKLTMYRRLFITNV